MGRQPVLQDYGNIQMPESDNTLTIENNRLFESRKQHDAQMNQRKAEQKQKEQGDATDFITKLDVPDIGDNTIDLYNDAELKKVQDELMGMMQKGAGVNEIKMAAMPKLQKIGQGYTIAKNEYSKITEAQKNLMKDYPEGNAEAARNIMGKGMLENISEFNKDGSVKGYKDVSLINSNRNYSEDLFDPENMDAWYPSSINEVVSNIQKTRGLTPIEGQVKIINPRGGYTDKKYKGDISIYDRPTVDEEGRITGIGLDSETVSLGKNSDGTANIIKVMPKEKYEVLRGNGKAAMQFDKAVYDHIAKDIGINPKSLDPQALDVYSRNYALKMLEKTGLQGSSYNQFDIEKANPIKNITNNNIRVGGAKEVPVMDIVTPIKDYFTKNRDDQKPELKGIAQLNLFNNEVTSPIVAEVKSRYPDISVTADNIYYNEDGDNIWVMKANSAGKIDRKNDTPVFKLDKFSNIIGNKQQGQRSKNKSLTQAQSVKEDNKPAAAPKKEIKRSEIAGRAAAAGYSVKEYESLLKQKGVSIKD